jgi:hypothetical protein
MDVKRLSNPCSERLARLKSVFDEDSDHGPHAKPARET